MNIGIFTDTYYPQINGVATSTRILERELNRLGHQVFIFTTTDPHARAPHPRVFRIPSMPFVFLPTHRVALVYPPKLLLRIKKLKLDIVHTQSEFPLGVLGNLVADLYGLPKVHTYHTMYEDYTHYIANGHLITRGMAKRYSRLFCNRAQAVIAPVEKARASLLSYGVRKPIHVIPTGIDLTNFAFGGNAPSGAESDAEQAALKAGLGIAPGAPVVLFVGRVAKEKSVDVLIKAMPELLARLPGAVMLIVGGGPVVGELKQLAAELGVSGAVVFAGAKPWDEIGRYYRLGDVFVTASTSETQGLTYIEAIAARRAVVAKKDPSVEGLIEDGKTGYLFENDGELAGVLFRALTNREEALGIAGAAYGSVAELSSERFGERVAGLYEEVLRAYEPRRKPAVWRRLKSGIAVTLLKRDGQGKGLDGGE